jgi:predicted transglutaminase-like protease
MVHAARRGHYSFRWLGVWEMPQKRKRSNCSRFLFDLFNYQLKTIIMIQFFLFIIGIICAILNGMLFWKIWTMCNHVKFITETLVDESVSLKKDFINEVEKLHDEIKDSNDFNKAVVGLADRYYDRQNLKLVDFKAMIPNFHW